VIGLLLSVVGGLSYYVWEGAPRTKGGGTLPIASTPTVLAPQEPAKIPTALAPKELAKPVAKPPAGKEAEVREPTPVSVPKQETTAGENAPTTTFDFYKLLPDLKVGEPQESSKPGAKETAKTKEPTKESAKKEKAKESAKERTKESAGAVYIVQAGAFHTPQEADRLRARLAFLGLESSIQTVGVGTSQVWHRVRLGPFRNFNQATHIQQRLHQEGISSTLSRESRS
jgi:cell division protein FtsN